MIRAAAASALALLLVAPAAADAGRVRVKPVGKTAAQLKAELDVAPPGATRDGIRVELGVTRAFDKQDALGPVKARGVFTGKSKATGRRKVSHLELVDELGDASGPGMRLRSQDIDGDVDEPVVERVFRPVGSGRAAIRHEASDGARFLLLIGRGIFDYHGGDFEGDPEPGLAPDPPAPTPTP